MFLRMTSSACREARVPDPASGCCWKNCSTCGGRGHGHGHRGILRFTQLETKWFQDSYAIGMAVLVPRLTHRFMLHGSRIKLGIGPRDGAKVWPEPLNTHLWYCPHSCTSAHTSTRTHTRTHARTHAHTHTHVHTRTYKHTCTRTYTPQLAPAL